MGKDKLTKFAEISVLPNVAEHITFGKPTFRIDHQKELALAGRWNHDFFRADQPIWLELACGKGDYTLALAQLNQDLNFLGVDIKGNRLWKGATFAWHHQITNVGFLRGRIEQIDLFFAPGEIEGIWITFPDPFSKKGSVNRRLTAPIFIEKYRRISKPGASVYLKTDDRGLFEFTLAMIKETDCLLVECYDPLYPAHQDHPVYGVKTFYEEMHLANGKQIYLVHFRL